MTGLLRESDTQSPESGQDYLRLTPGDRLGIFLQAVSQHPSRRSLGLRGGQRSIRWGFHHGDSAQLDLSPCSSYRAEARTAFRAPEPLPADMVSGIGLIRVWSTFTPISRSRLAISGGTARRSWFRYHASRCLPIRPLITAGAPEEDQLAVAEFDRWGTVGFDALNRDRWPHTRWLSRSRYSRGVSRS